MKKILTVLLFAMGLTISSFASDTKSTNSNGTAVTDTTTAPAPAMTDSSKNQVNFNTELVLVSRNIYRGVEYGSSVAIQPKLAAEFCPYFELGSYATYTLNGNKNGYGNQLNVYASFKRKEFSLTFDDFFYFNSNDSLNNYFEMSSSKTNHFLELRAKYDSRVDFTAAYTIMQNSIYGANKAVYFELGYDVTDNFNLFASYITDASAQNFYDKGGVTGLGATASRKLNIKNCCSTILKTSLVLNPNYKNISKNMGVGSNPINLVASLTF